MTRPADIGEQSPGPGQCREVESVFGFRAVRDGRRSHPEDKEDAAPDRAVRCHGQTSGADATHRRGCDCGFWHTVRHSGAMPKPEKDKILDRVEKLIIAVKEAREKANDADAGAKP